MGLHLFTRTYLETGDGVFTAHFSKNGLARLDFPSHGPLSVSGEAEESPLMARWRALTQAALQQALRGSAPVTLPPLDLGGGTPFQRRVWETLRRIPLGRTMTYGEVAKAIGRLQAMRAVGQACGANPIPVLIPCHRVLAAHGGIGGFSGGLPWKTKLLSREGVLLTGTAIESEAV